MLSNKPKKIATVVQWQPVLDRPVHLFDVADDTRTWDIILQRALLFCAFSGLSIDEAKMIAHVLNLIDKTWGASAIAQTCAEEYMMISCLAAKRLGDLTIKHLASQYHPYRIDAYALAGGIVEFFIERFGNISPKSPFRFVEDKGILVPPFPSRFIELYDLLNSVSIGCQIEPGWLDVNRVDWDDPSRMIRFDALFGALSVICATARYEYNLDLYNMFVERSHNHWDAFLDILTNYPSIFSLWNTKLLQHMIKNRETKP